MERASFRLGLAGFQGGYFLITGLWPIVHLASFEAVTGSKTDDWLVQTVGALVVAVGATLLWAGARGRVRATPSFLGAASALAFASVDLVFGIRGVISAIYLADGVLQCIFLAAWVTAWPRLRPSPAGEPTGART